MIIHYRILSNWSPVSKDKNTVELINKIALVDTSKGMLKVSGQSALKVKQKLPQNLYENLKNDFPYLGL